MANKTPKDATEVPKDLGVSEPVKLKHLESLPNGKCGDCDMPFAVCKGDHVVRNLAQVVILNGVKFGPGKCVTPRNADIFLHVTIPE